MDKEIDERKILKKIFDVIAKQKEFDSLLCLIIIEREGKEFALYLTLEATYRIYDDGRIRYSKRWTKKFLDELDGLFIDETTFNTLEKWIRN